MTNRLRVLPGESIEIEPVGPGISEYCPTRCWARTISGIRCQKGGRYTWKPEGERVPYALCSVHARMLRNEPDRLVILAPNWKPEAKAFDKRIKHWKQANGLELTPDRRRSK